MASEKAPRNQVLPSESWPAQVAELAERYRNECAHSLHVTRLALNFFDRAAAHVGLGQPDKLLLETASLVHDIGYADHPANHAVWGAEIVLKEDIPSLAASQRRCLAAILLLDARKYEKGLEHPMMSSLRCRDKAMKIAAFLRVADGLDHGRLQDAEIVSLRKIYGRLRLTVRTFYKGNIERASEKADLWQRVFTLPLDIVQQEPAEAAEPLHRLVSNSLPLVENVRRILQLEYRRIADNREKAVSSDDPEGIHELRVSIRRLRAGLRLFKDCIPSNSFCPLNEGLRTLGDDLSTIRDQDVWLAFLKEKGEKAEAAAPDTEILEFLANQQPADDDRRKFISSRLSDPAYSVLARRIEYFLRSDLPRHEPKGEHSFQDVASGQLRRLLRVIERSAEPESPEATEEIHEIRRLFRRARYWAEFSAPVLGKPVTRLERRLRKTAGILGELHDRAVFLDRLASGPVDAPLSLKQATGVEHLLLWDEFLEYRPKLRKEVKRCLKALRRE